MVAPAVVAAGISAVGSIFGGLFGRKKERTTSTVDYVQMRKNAEAAGFNPLTAIRNGGAAGFTTTFGSGGGPTFGSAVSDAISAGVNTWLNYDPLKEKRALAEYNLLNAQLRNLDAETDSIRKYGNLNPPVRTAGQVVSGSNPASRPANPWQEVPGVVVDGQAYLSMPGEASAQVIEDAHGGLAGEIFGARTAFNRFILGHGKVPMPTRRPPPAVPVRRPKAGWGTPTRWRLTPSMTW